MPTAVQTRPVGGPRSEIDACAPGSKKALSFALTILRSALHPPHAHPPPPRPTRAMGSKRNKIRKVLSPSRAAPPPPPPEPQDDDALMDDLLAQLDEKDQASKAEAATVLGEVAQQKAEQADAAPSRSRSRHQARQARKAALLAEQYGGTQHSEADAKLEAEAREEEATINKTCDELGVKMFEINPDGHCLFSAVADQLAILGILPSNQATYVATRHAAADYIQAHPDDFLPFLPSFEDEDGSTDSGLMSPKEFEAYCAKIRDTAVWGGEPEIMALTQAYNVPIHVIQGPAPHIVVHNPSDAPPADESRVVRISYHRRMYGLGEHYNSLRPKRTISNGIKSIFTGTSPP
ncbi:OTU-like cysteine protease [Phanerochaete sordida]|uniref:OTU-like cysteine protease n=1 Tax=Phanerochaete sordida TaxID=48140 RepID=A0A9P3LA55_9APHY|nr:OTU-like cysteine protease [Phanerochaete sordida]